VAAQNIQYDQTTLTAPANTAFVIEFTNNDAGVPHNVSIKDQSGMEMFKGDIFNGVDTKQYQVPALPAGTYTFFCAVHPNMTGTLTVQ
jgi:plastocyanin